MNCGWSRCPTKSAGRTTAATLLLRVVDQPVRVLLLEGKPYWDGKFLARTLQADPSIELTAVIRMGEGRFLKRTLKRGTDAAAANVPEEWMVMADPAAILSDASFLRGCQVVVLGRDADVFLNDESVTQLRNWVAREGGSLVCARGPAGLASQPAAGERPAGRVDGEPGIAGSLQPDRSRPRSALAALRRRRRSGSTADACDRRAGRAAETAGGGAGDWRHSARRQRSGRFVPAVRQRPGGRHRRGRHVALGVPCAAAAGARRCLPRPLAGPDALAGRERRPVARSEAGAARRERCASPPTSPASATLLMRDDQATGATPTVELRGTGIDGARTVKPAALGEEPGVFRVSFGVLPEGSYRAKITGATAADSAAETAFDVRSTGDEQLDLTARPDLMARIAAESGGAVLTGTAPADVVAQFKAERERAKSERSRAPAGVGSGLGASRRVRCLDDRLGAAALGGVGMNRQLNEDVEMTTLPLHSQLRRFGRRLLALGVAAGIGWGITAAIVAAIAAAWIDLVWELPPAVRIAGIVIALVCGVGVLVAAGLRTWSQVAAGARSTSRFRRPDSGQIGAGVDLMMGDDRARR